MNNRSESGAIPENPACQQWGLKRAMTPLFWSTSGAGRRPPAFSRGPRRV